MAADEKVTLVYEHELPNVPGKSIKAVRVEYGPGGSSPAQPIRIPPSAMRPFWKERSAAPSMTDRS
jgi:hypothetical protein